MTFPDIGFATPKAAASTQKHADVEDHLVTGEQQYSGTAAAKLIGEALTDQELRAHSEWRNFGGEERRHPPMRGWLTVPLIGTDGGNYGFIQASDRLEGDFTAQDEANLVRLASLTSTALDALAQLHLPEYRAKVADPSP
jgi:GAF domain-containing protein